MQVLVYLRPHEGTKDFSVNFCLSQWCSGTLSQIAAMIYCTTCKEDRMWEKVYL